MSVTKEQALKIQCMVLALKETYLEIPDVAKDKNNLHISIFNKLLESANLPKGFFGDDSTDFRNFTSLRKMIGIKDGGVNFYPADIIGNGISKDTPEEEVMRMAEEFVEELKLTVDSSKVDAAMKRMHENLCDRFLNTSEYEIYRQKYERIEAELSGEKVEQDKEVKNEEEPEANPEINVMPEAEPVKEEEPELIKVPAAAGVADAANPYTGLLAMLKRAKTRAGSNSGEYNDVISAVKSLYEAKKKGCTPEALERKVKKAKEAVRAYCKHKAYDGVKHNSEPKLVAVEFVKDQLNAEIEAMSRHGMNVEKLATANTSVLSESALMEADTPQKTQYNNMLLRSYANLIIRNRMSKKEGRSEETMKKCEEHLFEKRCKLASTKFYENLTTQMNTQIGILEGKKNDKTAKVLCDSLKVLRSKITDARTNDLTLKENTEAMNKANKDARNALDKYLEAHTDDDNAAIDDLNDAITGMKSLGYMKERMKEKKKIVVEKPAVQEAPEMEVPNIG